MKRRLIELIVFLLLTCPAAAWSSDTGLVGFNILTEHYSADGSGLFFLYGSQTLGHLNPDLRFTIEGVGGLIDVSNPVNNSRSNLINDMVVAECSAALGLGDHLDIGFIFPIIMYEDTLDVNSQRRSSNSGIGDILLDAKIKFLKDKPGSLGLGLLSRLSTPTGNERRFTGWSTPTGEFRLIVDKTISNFYVTGNLGYRIVTRENVVNYVTGAVWNVVDDDRLTFGVGGRYSIPFQNRSWGLSAAIGGETMVSDAKEINTPLGFYIGIEKRFKNGLSIEAGAGRGITDAVGSPSYRAFVSLNYRGKLHRNEEPILSAKPPLP